MLCHAAHGVALHLYPVLLSVHILIALPTLSHRPVSFFKHLLHIKMSRNGRRLPMKSPPSLPPRCLFPQLPSAPSLCWMVVARGRGAHVRPGSGPGQACVSLLLATRAAARKGREGTWRPLKRRAPSPAPCISCLTVLGGEGSAAAALCELWGWLPPLYALRNAGFPLLPALLLTPSFLLPRHAPKGLRVLCPKKN